MNIILMQTQPSPQEIELLHTEFPQYLFLSPSPSGYKNLSEEHWSHVEVIFGNRLNQEELSKAKQLHWIHLPSTQTNRLCIDDVIKRGSILVTNTAEENIAQVGEFVLGIILSFSKNLLHWNEAERSPNIIWANKLRDTMWSLQDRTLLQVGLDKRGSEIARRCREMNMRVYGAEKKRSFHPYCHETLSYQDLEGFLPIADVVCLCLPNKPSWTHWFGSKEFNLMKKDSILIALGPHSIFDETALIEAANSDKFRGIWLDASYDTPPPLNSPLWNTPNILITPGIAPRPKNIQTQAFRTFLYNLRQYGHNNYTEMRNVFSLSKI